jgi:hypothetical protein
MFVRREAVRLSVLSHAGKEATSGVYSEGAVAGQVSPFVWLRSYTSLVRRRQGRRTGVLPKGSQETFAE